VSDPFTSWQEKVLPELAQKDAEEGRRAAWYAGTAYASTRLDAAREQLEHILAGLPNFPCRVDEMTEREFRIAEVAHACVGALQYLRQSLG
jgi:hypothetical protein